LSQSSCLCPTRSSFSPTTSQVRDLTVHLVCDAFLLDTSYSYMLACCIGRLKSVVKSVIFVWVIVLEVSSTNRLVWPTSLSRLLIGKKSTWKIHIRVCNDVGMYHVCVCLLSVCLCVCICMCGEVGYG